MSRLTASDINIAFDISIGEILTFEISAMVNDHGYLEYSGKLSKNEAEKALSNRYKGRKIQVTINNVIVFTGFPLEVSVCEINDVYTMNVSAVSFTKLLTYNKYSYFYQDQSQTFKDVLRKSLDFERGSVIGTADLEKIRKPILQYEETPWDFSIRIAGKIGSVITPNINMGNPYICLGLPSGDNYVTNTEQLKISNNHFNKIHASLEPSYSLEDERLFKLGDNIVCNNNHSKVITLNYTLLQGSIYCNYTLGKEEKYTPKIKTNPKQIGLSLTGSVIAVTGQEVKVCLSIPDDANNGKSTWFEFAPITNNGMYAMPPNGTEIALEWWSEKDGDIRAIHTVRQGAELSESPYKSLTTEYKKQMSMVPDRVAFTSDSNSISLIKKGIRFSTEKKIRIIAEKDITISSRKRLRVKTPEEVFIAKVGVESGILMSAREIDIKSSEVTMLSNEQTAAIEEPKRKSIKKVELNDAVVAALNASTPKF